MSDTLDLLSLRAFDRTSQDLGYDFVVFGGVRGIEKYLPILFNVLEALYMSTTAKLYLRVWARSEVALSTDWPLSSIILFSLL